VLNIKNSYIIGDYRYNKHRNKNKRLSQYEIAKTLTNEIEAERNYLLPL
jgi:hypothetical protein